MATDARLPIGTRVIVGDASPGIIEQDRHAYNPAIKGALVRFANGSAQWIPWPYIRRDDAVEAPRP